MVVIVDTSPLKYLDAVWRERCDPAAPKALANWVASLPSWIELPHAAHLGRRRSERFSTR